MKKILFTLLSIVLMMSCLSCANQQNTENSIENNTLETTGSFDHETEEIMSSDVSDNSSYSDVSEKSAIGGGDSNACPVHEMSFHLYPQELVEYVGQEKFDQWAWESEGCYERNEEGCYINRDAYKFIEEFNIPNEVVINAYKNNYYLLDWNMEALLAKDYESFEAYSRNHENRDEYNNSLWVEYILKLDLIEEIGKKTDSKSTTFYNEIKSTENAVANYTISELVTNSSLTKEDITNLLALITTKENEPYKADHFTYNFDLLFGSGISVLNNNITAIDPKPYESEVMLKDALLHVTDNSVTY